MFIYQEQRQIYLAGCFFKYVKMIGLNDAAICVHLRVHFEIISKEIVLFYVFCTFIDA